MPDPSPIDLVTAQELDDWAAHYASTATEFYPESVFPPPKVGVDRSPDCFAAAGYRNAYRAVASDLRRRARELRGGAAS